MSALLIAPVIGEVRAFDAALASETPPDAPAGSNVAEILAHAQAVKEDVLAYRQQLYADKEALESEFAAKRKEAVERVEQRRTEIAEENEERLAKADERLEKMIAQAKEGMARTRKARERQVAELQRSVERARQHLEQSVEETKEEQAERYTAALKAKDEVQQELEKLDEQYQVQKAKLDDGAEASRESRLENWEKRVALPAAVRAALKAAARARAEEAKRPKNIPNGGPTVTYSWRTLIDQEATTWWAENNYSVFRGWRNLNSFNPTLSVWLNLWEFSSGEHASDAHELTWAERLGSLEGAIFDVAGGMIIASAGGRMKQLLRHIDPAWTRPFCSWFAGKCFVAGTPTHVDETGGQVWYASAGGVLTVSLGVLIGIECNERRQRKKKRVGEDDSDDKNELRISDDELTTGEDDQ